MRIEDGEWRVQRMEDEDGSSPPSILHHHLEFPPTSYSLSFIFFFWEKEVGWIITVALWTLSSNWQPICLFLWIYSQFTSFSDCTANSPLSSNVQLSVYLVVYSVSHFLIISGFLDYIFIFEISKLLTNPKRPCPIAYLRWGENAVSVLVHSFLLWYWAMSVLRPVLFTCFEQIKMTWPSGQNIPQHTHFSLH